MNVQFLLGMKLNYQIFILILYFVNDKNRVESRYFFSQFCVSFCLGVHGFFCLCSSCGDHLVDLFWEIDWLLHGCGNEGNRVA